jgi:hypothetical protein
VSFESVVTALVVFALPWAAPDIVGGCCGDFGLRFKLFVL